MSRRPRGRASIIRRGTTMGTTTGAGTGRATIAPDRPTTTAAIMAIGGTEGAQSRHALAMGTAWN